MNDYRSAEEHAGWYWLEARDRSPSFALITLSQVGEVAARITAWQDRVETIYLRFDRDRQSVDIHIEVSGKPPWSIDSTVGVSDEHAEALADASTPWDFDPPRIFDLMVTRNEHLTSLLSMSRNALSPAMAPASPMDRPRPR